MHNYLHNLFSEYFFKQKLYIFLIAFIHCFFHQVSDINCFALKYFLKTFQKSINSNEKKLCFSKISEKWLKCKKVLIKQNLHLITYVIKQYQSFEKHQKIWDPLNKPFWLKRLLLLIMQMIIEWPIMPAQCI